MAETNVMRQQNEAGAKTAPVSDIQAESTPFGESISLEELAKQQGVSPVHDLNEIVALWPADDDSEELLHFILSERAARRKLSQGRDNIS